MCRRMCRFEERRYFLFHSLSSLSCNDKRKIVAGTETRDRHLATSGGQSIQLQQGRERGEGDVAEESSAVAVAAQVEGDDGQRGLEELQEHARRTAREGELGRSPVLLCVFVNVS